MYYLKAVVLSSASTSLIQIIFYAGVLGYLLENSPSTVFRSCNLFPQNNCLRVCPWLEIAMTMCHLGYWKSRSSVVHTFVHVPEFQHSALILMYNSINSTVVISLRLGLISWTSSSYNLPDAYFKFVRLDLQNVLLWQKLFNIQSYIKSFMKQPCLCVIRLES